MLNKRQYATMKKISRRKISYSDAGFAKLSSDSAYGQYLLDELNRLECVKSTGKDFFDHSENAFFKATPKGLAAVADYRHALNKERFDRAFSFLSGLVVGLISGFAVTAFSVWMMARFTT